MGNLADKFLDALFPFDTSCFLCGKEAVADDMGICEECYKLLTPSRYIDCVEPLLGIYAPLEYNEYLAHAIHSFKYYNKPYMAKNFARLIARGLDFKADILIPVPLSKKRHRERGYNQSALLALELSKLISIPVENRALTRVRYTPPQAQLSLDERKSNVKDAFKSKNVDGQNIILIDDVTTSSSTLYACASALKAAGAQKIYAACIAAAYKKITP